MGYVDYYASIFAHQRHDIMNVTEIGVAAGQSIQMWHEYFPNANIFGLHVGITDSVKQNLAKLKRAKLFEFDSAKEGAIAEHAFELETMDIIIEDALHTFPQQQDLFLQWWPYLRYGGYYIIE